MLLRTVAVCGRTFLGFSAPVAVLRSEHVEMAEMLDTVETESSSRHESASSDSYRRGVSWAHQCLGDGALLPVGVLAVLGITVDRPESIDTALLTSDSSPVAVRADGAAHEGSASSSGQDMKAGRGGRAPADGLAGLVHRASESSAPARRTDVRLRSPGVRCWSTSLNVIADTGRDMAAGRAGPTSTVGARAACPVRGRAMPCVPGPRLAPRRPSQPRPCPLEHVGPKLRGRG